MTDPEVRTGLPAVEAGQRLHDAYVDRTQLGRLLIATSRLSGTFTLRSRAHSDVYFDKYLFEANPDLLRAVVGLAEPLIPAETEILAGLELGGVAVATALSLSSGLPQVMVRKQPKTYGTAKLVEGGEVSGRQVLVVEDVISTGGQVIASTRELRALGAQGVGSARRLCSVHRRSSGRHSRADFPRDRGRPSIHPRGAGSGLLSTGNRVADTSPHRASTAHHDPGPYRLVAGSGRRSFQ
jgi:orotate phosphoribosyltransferase